MATTAASTNAVACQEHKCLLFFEYEVEIDS